MSRLSSCDSCKPCAALRSIAISRRSVSLLVAVTVALMVAASIFRCAVQRCQPSISSLRWLTSIGGNTALTTIRRAGVDDLAVALDAALSAVQQPPYISKRTYATCNASRRPHCRCETPGNAPKPASGGRLGGGIADHLEPCRQRHCH